MSIHIYGFTGVQLCTLIYLLLTEVFVFRVLGTDALIQEEIRRRSGKNRVKWAFRTWLEREGDKRKLALGRSRIRLEDREMINQANLGDCGHDAMISELLMGWDKTMSIHYLLHGTDTRDYNFEVWNNS